MIIKFFFALFICWFQWYPLAYGLDIEKLNKMTPEERSAWVSNFVEEDLLKKDSARAFSETSTLFRLADKWDAPDITAQTYIGQGNYLLNVLHDPERARSKYAQGVDFANSHNLKALSGAMLLQIGKSYNQQDQQVLAYEYYFRAHDIFVKIGFDNILRIDKYEYDIGRFLYDLQDYNTAIEHLLTAEKHPNSGSIVRYEVLEVMGWCYQQIGNSGEAMEYLQKRLQLAQEEKNNGWIGETSVDIGESHLGDGCYPEARIYLATGEKLCEESNHLQTAAWALILLSKVNMHEGNVYAAADKLTKAEAYLKQANVKDWYPDLYRGWVLIYEQSGDFREAYRHQQLYEHSSDSARRVTEVRNYGNIQIRLESRRHMVQIAQKEQEAQTDGMLMALAFLLIIVLGGGAYLGWNYQHRRQKDLLVAKQEVEEELERVLSQQVITEQQQQQHLEQQQQQQLVEEEIKPVVGLGMPAADDTSSASTSSSFPSALPVDPKAEQNAKEALEQILKVVLLTEEDSRRFRLYFEKIHPGFFAQLRVKFPDLTQSETRLLALTKLNLKTKEMSEILNVEPNSIRRLRNRIRQKYNLPAGDNLENFFTTG